MIKGNKKLDKGRGNTKAKKMLWFYGSPPDCRILVVLDSTMSSGYGRLAVPRWAVLEGATEKNKYHRTVVELAKHLR